MSNNIHRQFKALIITFQTVLLLALSLQPASAEDLLGIYKLILENDPQRHIDSAVLESSKARSAVKKSTLLPYLSLEGGYYHSNTDSINTDSLAEFSGGIDTSTRLEETRYGLRLSQPLLDLPSLYEYKGSKIDVQISSMKQQLRSQELILHTVQLYLNTLREADNWMTASSQFRANQRLTKELQQRYEIGLASIVDLNEIEAFNAQLGAEKTIAMERVKNSIDKLSLIAGAEISGIHSLKNDVDILSLKNFETKKHWLKNSLDSNVEIAIANLSLRAAKLKYQARKNEFRPKINLSASIFDSQFKNVRNNFAFENDLDDFVVAVNVEIPLYAGGRINNQSKEALYELKRNEALVTKVKRSARLKATELYNQLASDHLILEALKKSVISSVNAVQQTKVGLELGSSTLVELLNAQRRLSEVQNQVANKKYSLLINYVRLKKVAGTLDTSVLRQINASLSQIRLISPENLASPED